jgi:hypothetical protein
MKRSETVINVGFSGTLDGLKRSYFTHGQTHSQTRGQIHVQTHGQTRGQTHGQTMKQASLNAQKANSNAFSYGV